MFRPLWVRPTLFINIFPLGPQSGPPCVSRCRWLYFTPSKQRQDKGDKPPHPRPFLLPLNLIAPALPLTGSDFKGWKFKAGLWCLYSLKVPTGYANSSPRVTRTLKTELLLRTGFLHPKRVLFPLPFLGQWSTFVGLLPNEIWGFLSYWVCFWICKYHVVLISLCVSNGISLIPGCRVTPRFVLVRTSLPWQGWN